MKSISLYAILLPVVYALLFWLGNSDDFNDNSLWYDEAAPWLGEPPAGVSAELVRSRNAEAYPYIVYALPADDTLRQNIITTFQLESSYPGIYDNHGISPIYPAEKETILSASTTLYPRLELRPDGSMLLTLYDDNNRELKDETLVKSIPIPHPDYLPNRNVETARSVMLAVLCFLLPGLFCCVGWLWVQRRPIRSGETLVICLVIPAVVAYIGAYVDFYMHGFNKSYSVFSAIFSVLSNVLCAAVLLVLTGTVRWLWRQIK